jgi:arsenate reductase
MKVLIFLLVLSSSLVSMAQNKTIVFVCEHGSAKSVIAAAYFNKLAKERNLSWTAVSRGTNPDAELPAHIIDGLQKDNLLDEQIKPQKLIQKDIDGSTEIIHFYPLPTGIQSFGKSRYWKDIEMTTGKYQLLREAIVPRLDVLLDSLAKH